MADTKISALPASTTPLAGTEVLPIVQSGVTKQVSVANLTAGRALSATELTLTTGNLIVSDGKGIDFSATPGTGTSELFDDYEEGTWTPTVNGTSGSITSYSARVATYTKIGNMCYLQAYIAISNIGTIAGNLNLGGFPFTSNITTNAFQQGHGRGNGLNALAAPANGLIGYQIGNNATIATIQVGTATGVLPMDGAALKNGCDLTVSIAYRVA
jgi:hypothetical protein